MTGTSASIIAPPRLTGNTQRDIDLIQDWIFGLYQALQLNVNLQDFVENTNARLDALEAAVTAIAGVDAALEGHSLSATFTDTEVEAALDTLGDRINDIRAAVSSFAGS